MGRGASRGAVRTDLDRGELSLRGDVPPGRAHQRLLSERQTVSEGNRRQAESGADAGIRGRADEGPQPSEGAAWQRCARCGRALLPDAADGMESDADSILEKKNLESLKRMKEANEFAQQLLAQRPDASDSYVALGIANYIIGSLSGAKRFFLWFGGIHGDKQLGMQQLEKAANSGRYLRPFAKILLALAARREKQPALAEKLLYELSEEFPASPLFAAEYAKVMGRPIPASMHPN